MQRIFSCLGGLLIGLPQSIDVLENMLYWTCIIDTCFGRYFIYKIRIMVGTGSVETILWWTTVPFLVFGFIGNVLVIRIVHKTQDMHTPTNYLLANMAVSDVITVLLIPISYQFAFGKFACKLDVLMDISITVSSITLMVLAVERYHALLKPFRIRLRLTDDNITKAIAFIWIASITICSPQFIFNEWSEQFATCLDAWTFKTNHTIRVYVIINAVLSTYIPLVVMFYCYGALIRGLYFTNTVCSETIGERSAEKKKLVITFILATIAFIVGYVPFVVFHTVDASTRDDNQTDFKLYSVLSSVFTFVFDCSLCFNPILYAFRSTNFQESFKRMLCRERGA